MRDGLRSGAPAGKGLHPWQASTATAEDAVLDVLVAGYPSVFCENGKCVLARIWDSCNFSVLKNFYNSLNFTFTIVVAKLGETYYL